MKTVKKQSMLSLVALLSCGLVSQLWAMDTQWSNSLNKSRSEALVNFLYQKYDQYKNDFVKFIPADISVEECKAVIAAKQQEIGQELASLSYKNVIFSSQTARNVGLILAGTVGRYVIEKYSHPLIYGEEYSHPYINGRKSSIVPLDFQDTAWDVVNYTHTGLGALSSIVGFGVIKDIKAMRDRKQQLSEENEKCAKILELLNKGA